MKHLYSFMPLHVFISFCLLVSFSDINAQVQTARYISIIPNSNAFYEYLPEGYEADQQTYPLMLFFHGAGESGDGSPSSLPAVLRNGVPRYISQGSFPTSFTVNGQVFKFIIISPQFKDWPTNNDVQSIIDYAVKTYRVNTNRIYITGLSMGGGATWEYVAGSVENGNRIAAIVPVCGASEPNADKIRNIAASNIPIWATHNQGDPTVPVSFTTGYVEGINGSTPAPSPLARVTIFPVNSHDAWSATFVPSFRENNMNIYEWMLQYQRGGQNIPPQVNAGPDINITLPGNSVKLATSAYDPDGSIVDYKWWYVSGPTQFSINNGNIPDPEISNMVAGTYTFRLIVTDNNGASAYDDVNITISNPFVSFFDIPGKIEAENYSAMSGIETENSYDSYGGLDIGHIDSDDWLDYKVNVKSDGRYSVNARVATPYGAQQFQIRKEDGSVLATVDVPQTGDFQAWTTVSTTVSLQAGVQTLRIYSVRGGWNLNWLDFAMEETGRSVGQTIPGKIEAESYDDMSGIQTENTWDEGGGLNIGHFDTGDWLAYKVNVAATGIYTITARIATPHGSQQFQVIKEDGTVLATIDLPATGDWQMWTSISAAIALDAGPQTLKIYSLRGSWNLNWLDFVNSYSASPAVPNANVLFEASGQRITSSQSQKAASSIYPNPANDNFVLDVSNRYTGTMNVQVMDQSGNVVKSVKLSKNQPVTIVRIPINELRPGIYYVKIQMPGWNESKRLIKL